MCRTRIYHGVPCIPSPSPLQEHAYAILCDFYGCKNDNFQMKNSDIFLIFAQKIDYGYMLYVEPPH